MIDAMMNHLWQSTLFAVGARALNFAIAPKRRPHAVLVVVCRIVQVSNSIFRAERCRRLSELAIISNPPCTSAAGAVGTTFLYCCRGDAGPASGPAIRGKH